jgi:FkbM family methyltransferase
MIIKRALVWALKQMNLVLVHSDKYRLINNPRPLDLLTKYDTTCKSVLHIGGHFAEEADEYLSAGIELAIFIEGDPTTFSIMQKRLENFPKFKGICSLLSDKTGKSKFYIASNGGASSSLLFPDRHLVKKPSIKFEKEIELPTARLDDLNLGQFDLVVIDVQGAEKLVIQGGLETINKAKALWVEVNSGSMYRGDADSSQIVEALSENFVPVYMNMGANYWGDALFLKKLV